MRYHPSFDRSALGLLSLVDTGAFLSGWEHPLPKEAWLDGDLLRYSFTSPTKLAGSDRLLATFLQISDAVGVLNFAQRFGPLLLCKHDLPASHRPLPYPIAYLVQFQGLKRMPAGVPEAWAHWEDATMCTPRGFLQSAPFEPVGPWLRFADEARAMINIAASLKAGRSAKREDWEVLYPLGSANSRRHGLKLAVYPPHPSEADRRTQRSLLSQALSTWLDLGRPSFVLDWNASRPKIVLHGTVFASLCVQLIATIAGSTSPGFCDGCGQTYWPTRRPYTNRPRHFCENCRLRGVPSRIRQSDYRERNREQKAPGGPMRKQGR